MHITKREKEILKSYCKRNKVLNSNAYIRKLIDTGDFQIIVEEETWIQSVDDYNHNTLNLHHYIEK